MGGETLNEPRIMAILAVGSICFMLGGWKWKWVRRFLMPFLFGVLLWGCANALTVVLSCVVLAGVLCLGYGESKSMVYRSLVFCAYVIPSLFFGFTVWQIITPLMCIALWRVSNDLVLADQFVWKVCEFFMGTLIACTFVGAV